jgi:glycosyltransferase involved in cell wall biosynthesis
MRKMNTPAKKPVRVCFVSPKAYPLFAPASEGVFGGAEVDLYLIGTELAKDEGFEVSFVTADYGQHDCEVIDDVTVIKSLDFNKNSLTGAVQIWRAMSRAGAEIYVLKTPSAGTPLVAMFCLFNNKSFVYRSASARECDGTYLKEHYWLGRAFAWSLHKAKTVFVQNSVDKDNMARTIGVSGIVIPNAHRLEESSSSDRSVILWVGRSAPIKRPELFIELAEKNPDRSFVMICQRATGDDNYDQLCSYAAEIKNLEFHKHVPFADINGFFSRAKVFVNTSDSEGFPNTFIQACKSATPVLSLAVDPDGFLDKFSCGLSCNGQTQRLSQGLKFMLEKDRYIELGRNAGKYAQENHNIEKVIEQYKAVFKQL